MIVNLQYLRGIAALMVVLFHVTDSSGRLGDALALPDFGIGQAGVDIFFVISGFIMWVTTCRRSDTAAGFLLKRLQRIAPLYWILTLALTGVAVLAPSLLHSTQFDFDHFAGSMLFFPVLHPTFGDYNPVLFVGWTLNYEMAFYLLFALALFLPVRARSEVLLSVIVLAVAAGYVFQPDGVAAFYTRPVVLEFAFGIVAGIAYMSAMTLGRSTALALLLAGALSLALFGTGDHSPLLDGLPAAMIVFGAAMVEKRGAPLFRSRLLLVLGDASYSVYLTHVLVLPVCQIVWKVGGLPTTGIWVGLYIAALTTACALAGIITYFCLEQPLLRLARTKVWRPAVKVALPD